LSQRDHSAITVTVEMEGHGVVFKALEAPAR
jgi:hypothetical protein